MKCPFCQGVIDDDSRYCDLCGKHLMFCPECRQPKKGTSCPRCGELLISAEEFFAEHNQGNASGHAAAPKPMSSPSGQSESASMSKPTGRSGYIEPKPLEKIDFNQIFDALLTLKGEDMTLYVKEGGFGRSGGIFPELGSCKFVSGHHGKIAFEDGEWKICDLGSTNGTAIDGVRLEKDKWYPLRKGQKLKIATLKFTVE